ncbi:hypothetical protein JCM19239_5997 [Vibrio variabilis]|nr:hypothetical protein JCM19239_5997 [Vibrio variabilis]
MVTANSTVMGGIHSTSVSLDDDGNNSGTFRIDNVNNLGGLGGAAGITAVAQNAGASSLIQQSIATNASVFTDD